VSICFCTVLGYQYRRNYVKAEKNNSTYVVERHQIEAPGESRIESQGRAENELYKEELEVTIAVGSYEDPVGSYANWYLASCQNQEISRFRNHFYSIACLTIIKPENTKPIVLSIAVAFLPGLDWDLITLLLSCVLTFTIPIVNFPNSF
jgi:hypothetical protein